MLEVKNLCCRRGGRMVFRDVSFAVAAGGFLLVSGANGSGKSSLLRVLAGLLQPVSGLVQGHEGARYIGHLDAAKPVLSVSEMVDYWAGLRGMDIGAAVACEGFGLGGLIDRPVRLLSAGQRRRLSLTRLMIGEARLWLLDEPTTALDATGRDMLWAQIVQHRAAGGMVVVASHENLPVADAQILRMDSA